MGTDIHMFVERRDPTGWQRLDCEVWDDRSYVTFAVLADVRNVYGLAGVRTHTQLEPISGPRGLPADIGAWASSTDTYWDHSFSWLLLSEVLAYDWGREIVRTGVVPLTEADRRSSQFDGDSLEEMRKDERVAPKDWSGGITEPGIVTVDYPTGCSMLADPGTREPGKTYYVQVEWRDALADACAPFLAWARSLATLGDPDQIRLVFGFDS